MMSAAREIWKILRTAVLAGAVAAAAGSASAQSPAPTKIDVVLASSALSSASILAALSAKTFAKHGLDVSYQNLAGASTDTVATVLAGKALFGTTGASTAIDAIRAGVPIQMIANVQRPSATLAVRKDVADRLAKEKGVTPASPIEERVRALKGMKLAAAPTGGANTTLLRAMFEMYGVDADRDLTLLPSSQTTVVAGLKGRQFDAAHWGLGTIEKNIQDGDAVKWISFTEGDVPGLNDFLYMVAFTKTDTIKSQPKLVEAFVQSLRDGADLFRTSPDKVVPAIKSEFFPTLEDVLWNATWKPAQVGAVADQRFSKQALDFTLQLQSRLLGRSYQGLTYERFVADLAR